MDATSEIPVGWDALFDALLDDADAWSARVRERVLAEFSVYATIPREDLERSLRWQMAHVLGAARAGRDSVSDAEVAELAEIGESRARQGVAVEVVLWAWSVGIELLIDRARELGPGVGADHSRVLDFAQSLLAWTDVALLTIAAAHRRTELELARREQQHRADLVRGVLFGTLAPGDVRGQLESYGVDPGREYVAVRARPADRSIERVLGFYDARQHRRGLSAIVDGDLAGFLRERPTGAPAGIVGIGPPRALDRLAESFRHTLRYRLGRFEELTGASLRDPVVAFEVWWALERASLRP